MARPSRWGWDNPEENSAEVSQERAVLRARMDAVEAEKQQALKDPGPSWRDWWFRSASKWYILVGCLVADVWVVTYWLELGSLLGAVLSLAAAVYAEYILYEFLWYRPPLLISFHRSHFRPTWWRPFRFGRWTPEAAIWAEQPHDELEEEGVNPKEFL